MKVLTWSARTVSSRVHSHCRAIVARVRFSCDHHMRLGPMCTICGADTTKEGAGETDIGDRDVKKDSESLMVLHDNPALRMNKEVGRFILFWFFVSLLCSIGRDAD